MATMQCRRAVQSLLQAGYKRSEFQVRTQTRRFWYQGRMVTEYGDVSIIVWSPLARQLELVPAVLQNGIDVTIPVMGGEPKYPSYYQSRGDIGKVEYLHFS